VMVKRVLDIGAVTLMFPFVQTPEEAEAAVARTRYPPEGVRGVAAMHRASRYGSTQGTCRAPTTGWR
jgi:2-keto-3-deoxy-L-rhamnonate aldolase RhmA